MQANKLVRPVFVREQRERRRMWRMCGKITSSFCAARYGVHVGPLQVGRLAEALFGASQTAAVKTGKAGSSCWKNAQRPDCNLRAWQSALPVEHSVSPCQPSDHTASVHCCALASHHKLNGRCDSNNRQINCVLIFLIYSCDTLCKPYDIYFQKKKSHCNQSAPLQI